MKIGEVAELTGLAPSAIRFYEQSGLLPAAERGANGYRSYPDTALDRLRLIQMAQSLGFSLDILRTVFASGNGFPKGDLLGRLDTRLHEIDAVMATLRAQRKDVANLRATLDQTWAGGTCVAVADLAESVVGTPARRRPARGQKKA